MENTLQVTENAVVSMDSREIAELTGKRHDNVMRTIRDLIADQILTPQFEESKFEHAGNTYKCFLLNKRDSIVVVARLSPEFTAAIVDRWQELEIQVHQSDSKRLAILEERNCQLINDLSDSMAHILGTKNQITSAKRQMRAMKAALVEYVDERVIDLRETAMDLRANGQAQASNELIQVVSAMLKDVKKIAVPSDPSLLEYAYISENLLHRYVVEKVDLLLRKRIKNPRIQDLNTSLGLSMDDGLDFL